MCMLLYIIYNVFIVNCSMLLLSTVIFRVNITKMLLWLFTIFLIYVTYVLYYTKIYMMFDFFVYGWITAVAYSFIVITFISFIFTIIFFNNYIYYYLSFLIIIYLSAYIILFTNNLIIFLIGYEFLLLPAFFILYKFAKTYRCAEAAYVMLFWTQFGALMLIFVNVYIMLKYNIYQFTEFTKLSLTINEQHILFISLLISFGVKMPIWPFHLWLPKAHVEAPTNFSIFLSGVLVKLAFFAFIKFVCYFYLMISFWFIIVWLVIGIFDISMRLYYQIDLKKIIAFTTVIEMHWLLLTLLNSSHLAYISGILMLVSHAVISSLFFLLTDSISRRFHTRYITELTSLWFFAPWLTTFILITNILFLGFPCTSLFWAEVILFSYILELNPAIYAFLLFLLFLSIPIILFKFWIQIMYGNLFVKMLYTDKPKIFTRYYDINKIEICMYIFLISHLVILGIYPTALLF